MAKTESKAPAPAPAPEQHERDRFDVVAPHPYTKRGGEAGTEWFRCGVAFPNQGGGYTLKLRTVDLPPSSVPVITDKARG
ncbi:hypothetical protein JH308_20450 [Xanthomonas campestris pv. campestris]|uniref:hypothetical protein n=1 Tax=Xanthomonas campestris TaxID=339 RepID=UPI002269BE49